MPLYEYQCKSCSERVEVIQKMSDPPPSHCAKCGGEMKKLFSSPAIQFKGSGFYKTDYASGTRADAKDSNTTSEAKSEAKSDTKAETKSEGASSSSTSSGKPDSGSSSGSTGA